MDIEKELMLIVDAKSGNQEMAVFYLPKDDNYNPEDGEWSIEIGNRCYSVRLGEVEGEISTSGKTLEEAIIKMKREVM